MQAGAGTPRLAEIVAALSLAADVGFSQPLEDGLKVCLLALGIGERMGLTEDELQRTFYLALARHIGCTANADELAGVAGDEIALRSRGPRLDLADRRSMLPQVLQHVALVAPLHRRPLVLARILGGNTAMLEAAAAVCETAGVLANRLGLPAEAARDVPLFYERWDGKGFLGTASGSELPRSVQAVQVAESADSFRRVDGEATALEMLRRRTGTVYAPPAVDAFVADSGPLFALLEAPEPWDAVLAAEPEPHLALSEAGADAAFEVMADFADMRSVYLGGHSRGVADLAAEAARRTDCSESDVVVLRRAGLAHDVGRVGISAAVWGKRGPLSSAEREAVRLHPYYSDRVLARPDWLAPIGRIASLHHERLDGSGYFRGCRAAEQPNLARLLAAADVLHALTEARPHRPELAVGAAAGVVRGEARAGRLDPDAVEAVIDASGEPARRRPSQAGDLSGREIEVLRLLARGLTKPQIAKRLVIAPKTADAHTQHIYAKIGVSTRAGATLFAIEHGLLDSLAG